MRKIFELIVVLASLFIVSDVYATTRTIETIPAYTHNELLDLPCREDVKIVVDDKSYVHFLVFDDDIIIYKDEMDEVISVFEKADKWQKISRKEGIVANKFLYENAKTHPDGFLELWFMSSSNDSVYIIFKIQKLSGDHKLVLINYSYIWSIVSALKRSNQVYEELLSSKAKANLLY